MKIRIFTLLFGFACIGGCTNSTAPQENVVRARKLSNRIVTASYALQFLTQKIVGDEIAVEFPAAAAPDPKTWSPKIDEIAGMQKADLIVVNGTGADYAQWLVRTTLPSNKICNSCEDIPLAQLISVADHQLVHTHGPEGEHSHAYMVPYTWLDPNLAITQAKTIAERLKKVYPKLAETFDQNLAELVKELQVIANQAQESESRNWSVVTTSPQLKYLTRFANIDDVHLLWFDSLIEQDSDATLQQLKKLVTESSAQVVLVDGPAHPMLEKYCVENKLEIIRIDLLEFKPGSGDFVSELRKCIEKLDSLGR